MNANRIRYKQRDFHLNEIDEMADLDWNLERFDADLHQLQIY